MNRRRFRNLLFLVLVLTGGVPYIFSKFQAPLLLERAKLVLPANSTGMHWATYAWIDDQEAVFVRTDLPSSPTAHWDFVKYNTVLHKESPLTELTQFVQNQGSFDGTSILAIAPDGRRLFWTGTATSKIWGSTFEGIERFQMRLDSTWTQPLWMEDSVHLVAYTSEPHTGNLFYGKLYDRKTGKSTKRFGVPPNLTFGKVARNDRLYAWKSDAMIGDVTDQTTVVEVEAGQEASTGHEHLIHLPFKALVWNRDISPQGDRIAWTLLQPNAVNPTEDWLQRHIPALRRPKRPEMSLWVSHIDGSQMHEIGVMSLDPVSDTPLDKAPSQFCWLPGGKMVSFLFNDACYIVSAD